MLEQWDELGPAGLEFYGGTCASISHELKNSLALINENAGLMNDLLIRAQQGHPLDHEKVARIAERIAKHVGIANGTIANLNRFGHLIDEPRRQVDVYEAVALAVNLHLRLASQKRVEIVIESVDEGVQLMTRPFELGNILGACIKAALPAAQGTLSVQIATTESGVDIHFIGITPDALELPSGNAVKALLNALAATCEVRPENHCLTLGLRR
ncbi:hypothetical protein [Desulfovibrio ferrophilus]|uniref:Histidine kinase A domain protein n=1 Tax=Desulfovibrio ferrophilus TaxID=241368 RepID=A0A2Z6AVV9_9BACT|nr:hypothetical protein [Desulfovibrio ferrophilus]BBD07374.1 histidine kinase A domain protein [Desulfovibrio ferrophilus]